MPTNNYPTEPLFLMCFPNLKSNQDELLVHWKPNWRRKKQNFKREVLLMPCLSVLLGSKSILLGNIVLTLGNKDILLGNISLTWGNNAVLLCSKLTKSGNFGTPVGDNSFLLGNNGGMLSNKMHGVLLPPLVRRNDYHSSDETASFLAVTLRSEYRHLKDEAHVIAREERPKRSAFMPAAVRRNDYHSRHETPSFLAVM